MTGFTVVIIVGHLFDTSGSFHRQVDKSVSLSIGHLYLFVLVSILFKADSPYKGFAWFHSFRLIDPGDEMIEVPYFFDPSSNTVVATPQDKKFVLVASSPPSNSSCGYYLKSWI